MAWILTWKSVRAGQVPSWLEDDVCVSVSKHV